MLRAMIRVVSMIVMLVVGVFLGIDSAEKNMQQLQATEGITKTVKVTPKDGKIEISVLGKTIETDNKQAIDITQKTEKEIDKISSLGNSLGSSIKDATKHSMEVIFGWMK